MRDSNDLIESATRPARVPLVPEITLLTADDPYELWDETGQDAPPFWAFPWAGGQGLARYILDHPGLVAGRTVLDVASGSGLVAIAAAKAGARRVMATDVDPRALAAIELNAAANNVPLTVRMLDLAMPGSWGADADTVLAADVFYERRLATRAAEFLRCASDGGADVLIADPGRAFLPHHAFTSVATLDVPVLRSLEDRTTKIVTVYRLT